MASPRNGKSKSSGLRILWIPGRKRSHPKGRLDATSKNVIYSSRQKKNEMWSLGGSKGQKDLLTLDIDKTYDGPSVSGLSLMPATCTIGASGCEAINSKSGDIKTTFSTASTAEILSEDKMPATITLSPAKADQIINGNKFDISGKNIDEFNINDLPDIPKNDQKLNGIENYDEEHSISTLNSRKYRNHHNSEQQAQLQANINSIESLNETNLKSLHDLAWIDELYECADDQTKNSIRKKKKTSHKEKDQLDGIPVRLSSNNNNKPPPEDEDEKVVKCLYYTLMCCDCTIS